MNDGKALAVVAVILGIFGMYLVKENKFAPIRDALFAPDTGRGVTLGRFTIAVLVYLFIVTFLNDRQALLFSTVIVFGALTVERRNLPEGEDTIGTLLG